jgi:hypothetical protein
MQPRRRSPWKFVGLGCGALVAAAVVAFVAFLYVGQRMAREVREQMTDRSSRRTAVRELLGVTRFPEGYEPVLGLSVPLLGRVAILEGSQDAPGSTPRGMFLYLDRAQSRRPAGQDDDLRRMLALRGLAFERVEPLASGRLPVGDATFAYRTLRARIETRAGSGWPALAALVDFRCPLPDDRVRYAAWIEPAPGPDAPTSEDPLADTPADPEALVAYLSHFRPCPDGEAASD